MHQQKGKKILIYLFLFLIVGSINNGILIYVGIDINDNLDDLDWVVKKVLNLRIFNDDLGLMNLSVRDVNGEILLISQFTLMASTKKGNRPSYIKLSLIHI